MLTRKLALLLIAALQCTTTQANVINHFNSIKSDPNSLYAFFKGMPKGGELHYHLAGGSYPETLLKLANSGNYCLDKTSFIATKNLEPCPGIKSQDLMDQPDFYYSVVNSWSMRDFVPGKESGHDHFFNGFHKYMSLVVDYKPQLLVDIIQRAATQQEQYLEVLDMSDNASSRNFGSALSKLSSFEKKRQFLLANPEFQKNIATTVFEADHLIDQTQEEMGCKTKPENLGCSVKITFLYYVLREQPLDNLFAQALNAFEAVSRSKGALVGVNLVQPEYGIISLRDYSQQMKVFQYLHSIYPQVKVSLHAGELTSEIVSPSNLQDHIHDAVFVAQASRIGHGTDIAHEQDAEKTVQNMAKNHVPVEINLISNLRILQVSGRNHPLHYYLSNQVPIVLSTDDEGILRTDLTTQYVTAVIDQGLDYPTLKQMNRNTLTYAFVPGKSLWADADKARLRQECLDLNAKTCTLFIKDNEKAKLQWNLEQQLKNFENSF